MGDGLALPRIALSSCPMSARRQARRRAAKPISAFAAYRRPRRRRWCAAVFDSVAGRYDLMNDLMSGGIHRWWKDEMIAWLAPRAGPDAARCRWRHRRHRPPGAEAARSGERRRRRCLRRQRRRCSRSAAPARSTTASLPASNGCAATPRRCRSPIAASTSTRSPLACATSPDIERALAEARRVLKPGGRFICLEFAPAVVPWLAARLRSLQLSRAAADRPGRHRRPRRLHLSRREHPPLSAAGRALRADRSGRSRAGAVPQSDRRHRRVTFGLAALSVAAVFGLFRSLRHVARLVGIGSDPGAPRRAVSVRADRTARYGFARGARRAAARRRRARPGQRLAAAFRRSARLHQARPDAGDARRPARRRNRRRSGPAAGQAAAVSRRARRGR